LVGPQRWPDLLGCYLPDLDETPPRAGDSPLPWRPTRYSTASVSLMVAKLGTLFLTWFPIIRALLRGFRDMFFLDWTEYFTNDEDIMAKSNFGQERF
ncbi:hypothetical protein KCU65_g465, partial [Aureobasidium melanogenum]